MVRNDKSRQRQQKTMLQPTNDEGSNGQAAAGVKSTRKKLLTIGIKSGQQQECQWLYDIVQ
jgi:hypothetical protein